MTAWRKIDECPKLEDTPYLIKTSEGPRIAEWNDGDWCEWFEGEYDGTVIDSKVLGWMEIPE